MTTDDIRNLVKDNISRFVVVKEASDNESPMEFTVTLSLDYERFSEWLSYMLQAS